MRDRSKIAMKMTRLQGQLTADQYEIVCQIVNEYEGTIAHMQRQRAFLRTHYEKQIKKCQEKDHD